MVARAAAGDHRSMLPDSFAARPGYGLSDLALLTSILAFAVWVTAVSVTLSLAVFIIGIPVALGRGVRDALDRRARPAQRHARVRTPGARAAIATHVSGGVLRRVRVTLGDPQVWRDLAWLITHSIVGFAFGVIALSLVGSVLGAGHAARLVLVGARRHRARPLAGGFAVVGAAHVAARAPALGHHRVRAARDGALPRLAGRGVSLGRSASRAPPRAARRSRR